MVYPKGFVEELSLDTYVVYKCDGIIIWEDTDLGMFTIDELYIMWKTDQKYRDQP